MLPKSKVGSANVITVAGPAGTVGGFLGGKAVGAWAGSSAASAGISIYNAWCDFF